MLQRLQKIIADRGYCSRRHAEELITAGQVKVNNRLVRELGLKFEEDTCVIEIEGNLLPPALKEYHYLMINKPLGFICTMDDPQGRKTVDLLVPSQYGRLYPVGRLDINSSGLLFMTNDGEFAELVTHPSSSLGKTYRVEMDAAMKVKEKKALESGIRLEDGMTSPAQVRIVSVGLSKTVFDITIHEGKNREVRRMVEALGHHVESLKRIAIGDVKLGDLPSGAYKELSEETVNHIKELCLYNKAHNTYKKDA